MLDPILSLAFSMHANRGVYALLLGSGVSRSAGIPTGWEVVLELVEKLAQSQGLNTEGNAEAWYKDKYGHKPDYSDLINKLARQPSERCQLLKPYFEPNEPERDEGLKRPTEAHKLIAKLVVQGYIRVILTTNFDRLMEQALQAEGITPDVISTKDAIKGAQPLIHSQCTVIKLNGDYLDSRIKNTEAELASYPAPLKKLLDRVLDEFGLVIAGWSGEWDSALEDAMRRRPNRRYSTYWCAKGETSVGAQDLIQHLGAETVQIEDADSFFTLLHEKVQSLADFDKPHPLSADIAVATVKRYLVKEEHYIRLEELIRDETNKVVAQLSEESVRAVTGLKPDNLLQQLDYYENCLEILLPILIYGSYYGSTQHSRHWVEVLQRLADTRLNCEGSTAVLNASLWPAYLVSYALGISCVLSSNYEQLKELMAVQSRSDTGKKYYVCFLHPGEVTSQDHLKRLLGINRTFPAIERIENKLKHSFSNLVPDQTRFTKLFDRFEYLRNLIAYNEVESRTNVGAIPGLFLCRGCSFPGRPNEEHICKEIEREIIALDNNWPPLKVGFFNGSAMDVREIKYDFDTEWPQYRG